MADKEIIELESVSPDDLDEVADHAKELFEEEREINFNKGSFIEFWREVISSKKGVLIVARKVAEIVGGIGAISFKRQNTGELVGEKVTWYVSEDERGNEIGTMLFEEFENWAMERGVDVLVSSMSRYGSELREYHKERGYEPIEIKYEKAI